MKKYVFLVNLFTNISRTMFPFGFNKCLWYLVMMHCQEELLCVCTVMKCLSASHKPKLTPPIYKYKSNLHVSCAEVSCNFKRNHAKASFNYLEISIDRQVLYKNNSHLTEQETLTLTNLFCYQKTHQT